MPFEPLDARELAESIIRRNMSVKWGHPKYSCTSLTSQEMRTLCESVLTGLAEIERLRTAIFELADAIAEPPDPYGAIAILECIGFDGVAQWQAWREKAGRG